MGQAAAELLEGLPKALVLLVVLLTAAVACRVAGVDRKIETGRTAVRHQFVFVIGAAVEHMACVAVWLKCELVQRRSVGSCSYLCGCTVMLLGSSGVQALLHQDLVPTAYACCCMLLIHVYVCSIIDEAAL